MRPIFFTYKSINITWYMAFAVVLTIIGYIILKAISKGNKYKSDIEDYYFLALISGFLGSRLIYVLLNFNLYKDNITAALRINHYNLNLAGGVIIGLLVLYIGTNIQNKPFRNILNSLLIPFYFSMAVGVWTLQFEGILSSMTSYQTMLLSIIFIIALVSHSLLYEKYKNSNLIILAISLLSYYGVSII